MRLSAQKTTVNCRVGSLESWLVIKVQNMKVNCRVGSLEIYYYRQDAFDIC